MHSLTVIKGESKFLKFTVQDTARVPIDCSVTTCSLSFGNSGSTLFTKANADFDKSKSTAGELSVFCPFDTTGTYYAKLSITWTASSIVDISKHMVTVLSDL